MYQIYVFCPVVGLMYVAAQCIGATGGAGFVYA